VIIAALRDVPLDFNGRISIFSDCILAIMCSAQMESEGESAGRRDTLTPLFNCFSEV